MGRIGSGVEVRDASIRVNFTIDGTSYKPTLKDADGRPLRPTIPNIKYATKLINEIRQKIKLGVFVLGEYFPTDGQSGEITLARHLDAWLATLRLERSTLAGYASAVRFWKEAPYDAGKPHAKLGDKLLRTVTLADVKTALALRPELSGKTINNYVSVLHEALVLAVSDRVIQRNVAEEIPRAKWQRDPPDPFSRDEAERIIAFAQSHYPEPVYNLIEWWFFTGVRTGEMAGLRWPNVDLASRYMLVTEQIVMGEQKDSTKTGVARNVLLNERALGAVVRQRKHTQMVGEHVWLDPRYGTPWSDERAFRRSYWTPMLKTLGIRYRRPYNCRHTYATMMLMARRTPAWCAKQLGHSVEVFLRTYSKWIDGDQDQREMAGLEEWLSVPVDNKETGS